jgi:hypothetical protein
MRVTGIGLGKIDLLILMLWISDYANINGRAGMAAYSDDRYAVSIETGAGHGSVCG